MAVLSFVTAALALSATVSAHAHTPEEIRAELETRERITVHSKRALDKCADSPAALALKERAVSRRAAKMDTLRQKRGIKASKLPVAVPMLRNLVLICFDREAAP